jgi:crotonobetainyl-CoA:carnitine CoA-transferase CaiB-like acyl-CoA transferase
MKRPELARDARFKTAAQRRENASALDEIIAGWSREFEPRDVERMLQARSIPAHAVQNSAEYYVDPQVAHRGHFVELPHPTYGKTTVEGPRAKLSRTPAQARRAAPTLGQDNQHVLEKILGYDEDRIAEIVASGVLG